MKFLFGEVQNINRPNKFQIYNKTLQFSSYTQSISKCPFQDCIKNYWELFLQKIMTNKKATFYEVNKYLNPPKKKTYLD